LGIFTIQPLTAGGADLCSAEKNPGRKRLLDVISSTGNKTQEVIKIITQDVKILL
jgi:hypothetical protein